MKVPWILPWIIAPAIAGTVLATLVDPSSLPLIGTERIEGVFFKDGQAYFGHLDDNAITGTLTLRDVYYLGDAKGRGTDYDAALQKRGSVEVHQPADGMRIRRDNVIVIERIGANSPLARAIAAQRSLDRSAAK